MTYPESSAVSAGDATLASHYNNLRLDALHLGKAAADAAPLGTILERYESRLEIERLDTTKLRVPASASAPVSLLICGYLCQAVANVDLDAGDVPSGAAAAYYIFANRVDASTTFTLSVNTSITEAANQRRIGRFYWDGSKIVKDSVRSEFAELVANLLYYVDPQVCDGRLSLSTGVPAPDSDISSSATVYFTYFLGNRIALYVQDYGWRVYSFSELTLDVSGIASGKNIDVWVYDNAGTLTLSYTEWSNDTLRATALVRQDGVLVKSGSPTYRYLGSVRTSGAGVTCDTELKRFIWNNYNKLPKKLYRHDTTGEWTYASASWRQWRANSANQVAFIIGVSEHPVSLHLCGEARNGSGNAYFGVGIGLDRTNTNDADYLSAAQETGVNIFEKSFAVYNGYPGIGYHYLAFLEWSQSGTTKFVGDYGTPIKTGGTGWLLG